MEKKKPRSRRNYTASEKAEAVALAAELGLRPASRQLDIPKGTLHRWTKLATPEPAPSKPLPPPQPRRPVAKVYSPSQRALVLEHAAAHGVTAASKEHGVSRWTIYEWRRKVRLASQGTGSSHLRARPQRGRAPARP